MKTILHNPLNLNHTNSDCRYSHFICTDSTYAHADPRSTDKKPLIAAIMTKGSKSLNMRSALLHTIADLLGSVAVIAGALAMMIFGVYGLDAVLAMLISALLLRQSGFILLEGSTCDLDEIKNTLLQNENIASIDYLHVTQITENMLVASMHVWLFSGVKFEKVSDFISLLLIERCGIAHTTIQLSWQGGKQ